MKDYENELTFHDEYVEVRGQRPTEIPDVLLVRPVLTEEQCAHIRGLWKGDVKRYDLSDRSYGSTYLDANQLGTAKQCLDDYVAESLSFFGVTVSSFSEYLVSQYAVGNHFNTWHCDINLNPTTHAKIAFSVDVSDKTGHDGGIEFFPDFIGDQYIQTLPGEALSWPSFMYHKLPTVTRGARYSLVWFGLGKILT